jgi:hypothetical protein
MERPNVDYHREKYGLVALANKLKEEGWDVLLSVTPKSVGSLQLKGIEVPSIDATQHDADPGYKYNFYVDRGRRHDLVATRGSEILVIEGKGTSAARVSGLEQLVGRSIITAARLPEGAQTAILIPDSWAPLVASTAHPALEFIKVFTVSRGGDISTARWGRGGTH